MLKRIMCGVMIVVVSSCWLVLWIFKRFMVVFDVCVLVCF